MRSKQSQGGTYLDGEVGDRDAVGRSAGGRAVLVVLLNDNAVLGDAAELDVRVAGEAGSASVIGGSKWLENVDGNSCHDSVDHAYTSQCNICDSRSKQRLTSTESCFQRWCSYARAQRQ